MERLHHFRGAEKRDTRCWLDNLTERRKKNNSIQVNALFAIAFGALPMMDDELFRLTRAIAFILIKRISQSGQFAGHLAFGRMRRHPHAKTHTENEKIAQEYSIFCSRFSGLDVHYACLSQAEMGAISLIRARSCTLRLLPNGKMKKKKDV